MCHYNNRFVVGSMGMDAYRMSRIHSSHLSTVLNSDDMICTHKTKYKHPLAFFPLFGDYTLGK